MPRTTASRATKRATGPAASTGPAAAGKSSPVDKKSADLLRRVRSYVMAHRPIFARHGAVVATWRGYAGHRLGPYYRLSFRVDRIQRSLYLGECPAVAEEIRKLLRDLQAPLRERRAAARRLAEERRAARLRKRAERERAARAAAKTSASHKPLGKKKPPAAKPRKKKAGRARA